MASATKFKIKPRGYSAKIEATERALTEELERALGKGTVVPLVTGLTGRVAQKEGRPSAQPPAAPGSAAPPRPPMLQGKLRLAGISPRMQALLAPPPVPEKASLEGEIPSGYQDALSFHEKVKSYSDKYLDEVSTETFRMLQEQALDNYETLGQQRMVLTQRGIPRPVLLEQLKVAYTIMADEEGGSEAEKREAVDELMDHARALSDRELTSFVLQSDILLPRVRDFLYPV